MQSILNDMLPLYTDKVGRCLKANASLSKMECDMLLGIVSDFEKQGKEYDYHVALGKVANIMARYNNLPNAVIKDGKQVNIPLRPKALPFLIKQVLYYLAVKCIEYGLCTQQTIISEINSLGVKCSNNFFSRMEVPPISFQHSDKYIVPALSIKYNGQKNKEYAIAIGNLVSQAGKYNTFVDLFGGLGDASVAFPYKKDAIQIYNELNRMIYNLFEVIADKKMHLELISSIKLLQNYLRDGVNEWLLDVDFDVEIQKYFESIDRGKGTKKEFKSLNQGKNEYLADKNSLAENIKRQIEIMYENPQEMVLEYSDVVEAIQGIHDFVLRNAPNDKEFYLPSGVYSKEKVLTDVISLDHPYYSYFGHFEDVCCLAELYSISHLLKGTVESTFTLKRYSQEVVSKTRDFQQYRIFKYFAYFYNLHYTSVTIAEEDKVLHAVAELFLRNFTTHGDICDSAIIYMDKLSNKAKKEFIETDFETEISRRHERIKYISRRNVSYENVLAEHNGSKSLFMVDPPYVSSVGYVDKSNGVPEFTTDAMRQLIRGLKNSGVRFIFSHRACKAVDRNKNNAKLQVENRQIKEVVFETFRQEFKQENLYVLAIERCTLTNEKKEKVDNLAKLLEENKVAEIMITNYKLVDFQDGLYKGVRYKVYTYKQFMKILDKHLCISQG